MISSVYSYYLSHYGHKTNSKYDSHTKAQRKETYSKVARLNSQTPTYKIDFSEDAQKYAIDLKENARELTNIANELSDSKSGGMAYRKTAESSNPTAVSAEFIGDSSNPNVPEIDVAVKQLATNQQNIGNYLQPNSNLLSQGDYSFDLNINNLTYEFQFSIESGETTKDVQEKISRLINRANIGLNSKVSEDSLGNTAINISSDATGLTGIKPTIFNIKANNDKSEVYNNNPDEQSSVHNQDLVDTLGLDRVAQYPGNAIFSLNGEERIAQSNHIIISKSYELSFNSVTDEPAHIRLRADATSIADSIDELISGYNNLVSVAANQDNNVFDGNVRLQKEISAIARTYRKQLDSSGLKVNDNGLITVDRDAIMKSANEGSLSDTFSSLNSFKQAIQQKAEDISLNPMNYVNNKIVAYKNPNRTLNDPYNLSAYSGMMFNGYI
ncbi:MAG: hypothetical protein ACI4E1_09515 [Lachnospira sp.]